MKRRICVRSMGLGAVIMLIGLAVGAIVSPPLIAHGGAGVIGVFGEIVCTGLTVIDKDGNKAIVLNAEKWGNEVSVYDKKGNEVAILHADRPSPAGQGGNGVSVYDSHSNGRAHLRADKEWGNGVFVYDWHGNGAAFLISTEIGNRVSVNRAFTHGQAAIDLRAYHGNGITLYDTEGNIKWEKWVEP